MSDFDPYHKWLGIPPEEQPPDHYRLISLERFESDPEVIEAATDQRMAFLRSCTTGEHIAESQDILNEIAKVRVCLLNAKKKRAYDAELHRPSEHQSDEQHEVSLDVVSVKAIVISVAVLLVVGIGYGVYAVVSNESDRSFSDDGADQASVTIDGANQARVSIKWPLTEREGATVLIDGEKKEITEQERVDYARITTTTTVGSH